MAADVELVTDNPPGIAWVESNFESWSMRADTHDSVRHAQVAGDQAEDFAKAMIGWTEYSTVGGNHIKRYPPEPHPKKPWLVAKAVEFVRELAIPEASGPDSALIYPLVELAVTYEAIPGVVLLGDALKPVGMTSEVWRYIEHRVETSLAARIIPRGQLRFTELVATTNALPVPEPGVCMEESQTHHAKWMQVPMVFDPNNVPQLPGNLAVNIASVIGRTNDAEFLGYVKRSLFCLAPKRELKTMADGNPAWDITYSFEVRGGKVDTTGVANGTGTATPAWDRIRTTSGLFKRVYRTSDPPDQSISIFAEADFSLLFKFT